MYTWSEIVKFLSFYEISYNNDHIVLSDKNSYILLPVELLSIVVCLDSGMDVEKAVSHLNKNDSNINKEDLIHIVNHIYSYVDNELNIKSDKPNKELVTAYFPS